MNNSTEAQQLAAVQQDQSAIKYTAPPLDVIELALHTFN
jgi:hypothetical protein